MSDLAILTPDENSDLRRELYAGRLILLRSNDASQELVKTVSAEVERELGDAGSARTAQFRLTNTDFFSRVGRLRYRLYTSEQFHEQLLNVIEACGFMPGNHAFDPIRLRVISHCGEQNPSARAMYYGHRDTWYGNPQCMITWWIPLHDVCAEETFEFFPDEFSNSVPNDSEIFDFNAWVAAGQDKRIGWQDMNTGRTAGYPRLLGTPRGRRIPVTCSAGDVLLFSAQHLHQTRPNHTGKTRFSLDFRTVHLGDYDEGWEPANVDNRSQGCSLIQFVYPAGSTHYDVRT